MYIFYLFMSQESINYNKKVVRRYFYIPRYAGFRKGLVETVL